MATYDDEQTDDTDQPQHTPGSNPAEKHNKKTTTENLRQAEDSGGAADDGDNDAAAPESNGLFTPDEPTARGTSKRLVSVFRGASKRDKALFLAGSGASIGLAAVLLIGLGGFLKFFQLDHLMSNIEKKAFIRYQVDMNGRSSKWINAYLKLRLGEIEDPNLAPKDRDNILFRSNRVDNNNLLTDWYKTLRATKFENEVFEKEGIKFTSVAHRVNGAVVFRPAVITINDKPIKLNLTTAEINAIDNGDVNGFNGRLNDFIDVTAFKNDKEGRAAIASVTKRWYPHWYQAHKRYMLRKSIQNMTGIRSWRFFEKTRDKAHEGFVATRNKILIKALPEDTKSGKWVQCLLGIADCRNVTKDPNNPVNRSSSAVLSENCDAQSTNPACKTGKTDANGLDVNNDGSAEAGVADGVASAGAEEDLTKSLTNKILSQVLKKLNAATGVLSVLDTLNKINENIKKGALSNMVYIARATQAMGVYTVYNIMRDQIRTGDQVTSAEVNDAMESVNNAGSSQAFRDVINPAKTTAATGATASAADFAPAKNRAEYCSSLHQEAMLLPQNKDKAEHEFHFLCASEKIGDAQLATNIENGWKQSIGAVLFPILEVYNRSGLGIVNSWFNAVVDATFGKAMSAITNSILSGLGLQDNVKDLMAWLMTKAAAILGAGPQLPTRAPGGMIVNHILMGASASSEFGLRALGAAATNPQTAAMANQNVIAYQTQQNASMSFSEKYLSLSNPESSASQSLFAFTDGSNNFTVASMFGKMLSMPGTLLHSNAKAATTEDPYAAAKFGGVDTYDFPGECLNVDPLTMTPESSTNADDLGLIPASELTWDLISNGDTFNDRLFQNNPDPEKTNKVWNCAILDSAVRGSMAAPFTSDLLGPNALTNGGTSTGSTPAETPDATGWAWPINKNDYKGISQCWNAARSGGHHAGIDIPVSNKPVYAANSGTVAVTGYDGAAGNYMIIRHPGAGGGSDLWSTYEHLSSMRVKKGDSVTAGQQIGVSGNTGNSTGPHLHFGVAVRETLGSYSDNSQTRNPLSYLPKDGRDTSGC
ncbi:MAG TPA: M23 family metallopeptidase [Nevskiaceae bacterium]|nr:M23 family metallopeptidase [Nevskiaceae bacterium]